MKIVNNTKYQTKDLRKIFSACVKKIRQDEKGNRKLSRHLKIVVNTHKGQGWVGGCATYSWGWITIKLPLEYRRTHLTFEQSVADVMFHELGHNLGVKHNTNGDTIERFYKEWILKNITSDYAIHEKVVVKPPKEDIQLKRYNLVLKNIERAKTRFKRAKTLLVKWQRKLTYYEGKLALAGKLPPKGK